MNLYKIKIIIWGLVFMAIPLASDAQVAVEKAVKSSSILDLNLILTIISIVLLFPILLSSNTLILAAKQYINKKKESEGAKKVLSLIVLFAFSQIAFAADDTAKSGTMNLTYSMITWILLTVIFIEIIVMVYLFSQAKRFLVDPNSKEANKSAIEKTWDKINSFKPMEEESKMDTGHNYDGIRELDNITPPWFTTAFILSIIFAIVYLYRYHISKSAPLQVEEFNIAMAEAEKEKAQFLAIASNNIDENNVALLESDDIVKGKGLFIEKCAVCHEPNGASKPGGVGPNLTDEYWIHGGSLQEVFKSIKYGWPDKGMISWKDQLSPKQIAQVASFIHSIKGTIPAGGKEPQGDLYKEGASTSNNTNDSTKVEQNDSLIKK